MLALISQLPRRLARRLTPVGALVALVIAMNGTWATAQPVPGPAPAGPSPIPVRAASRAAKTTAPAPRSAAHPELSGKVNLNTATAAQLQLLPTVGPSKAERIITWRQKNGGFKRVADLRRVKGFGYKTWKRLEPFLDVQGDTTLAGKR